MKRFIVASHGELAKGIQSTIELFAGHDLPITYISAYTKADADLDTQLKKVFDSITDTDQVLIFTDLMGGSVNQKLSLRAVNYINVFIIAGFNLPVILEAVLSPDPIDQKYIAALVSKGRAGLQQVALPDKPMDSNDDDFLN
jgi:mannose/fructose-specific phosphotransferase system component IIA